MIGLEKFRVSVLRVKEFVRLGCDLGLVSLVQSLRCASAIGSERSSKWREMPCRDPLAMRQSFGLGLKV